MHTYLVIITQGSLYNFGVKRKFCTSKTTVIRIWYRSSYVYTDYSFECQGQMMSADLFARSRTKQIFSYANRKINKFFTKWSMVSLQCQMCIRVNKTGLSVVRAVTFSRWLHLVYVVRLTAYLKVKARITLGLTR